MTNETAKPGDVRRKEFIWGVVLAWTPILAITLQVFVQVFSALTAAKTTGLGAVAGGLSQALVTFGLTVFVAAQIAAVVLLVRSFSRNDALRSIVSTASICFSLMALIVVGISIWYFVSLSHH